MLAVFVLDTNSYNLYDATCLPHYEQNSYVCVCVKGFFREKLPHRFTIVLEKIFSSMTFISYIFFNFESCVTLTQSHCFKQEISDKETKRSGLVKFHRII